MYECMNVCMHACMYICMLYTCTVYVLYVYTYIYISILYIINSDELCMLYWAPGDPKIRCDLGVGTGRYAGYAAPVQCAQVQYLYGT